MMRAPLRLLMGIYASLWFLLSFAGCSNEPPPVEKVDHLALRRIVRNNPGEVTLINVWATWCEPCRKEMPDLLELRKRYGAKGFRLILVSADDPDSVETAVRPALKKFGVDFLTYIQQDSSDEVFIEGMSHEWNGALPASFLYDNGGNLNEIKVGKHTFTEFEEKITALLH